MAVFRPTRASMRKLLEEVLKENISLLDALTVDHWQQVFDLSAKLNFPDKVTILLRHVETEEILKALKNRYEGKIAQYEHLLEEEHNVNCAPHVATRVRRESSGRRQFGAVTAFLSLLILCVWWGVRSMKKFKIVEAAPSPPDMALSPMIQSTAPSMDRMRTPDPWERCFKIHRLAAELRQMNKHKTAKVLEGYVASCFIDASKKPPPLLGTKRKLELRQNARAKP